MALANLHVLLAGGAGVDEELRKALFGEVEDRKAELRCHEWLLFAYSQLVTTGDGTLKCWFKNFTCLSLLFQLRTVAYCPSVGFVSKDTRCLKWTRTC